MPVGDDEDVVKEIHDATVPRVDAVRGPAHGMPFAIIKAEGDQPDVADLEPADALDEATDGAAGAPVPTDAPGDPTDPGSPAWEAVDAAKARSATQTIVALKQLVADLAAREAAEASAGLADGDTNAWDLDDVNCALDYAISVLATYAVNEQAEADQIAEDSEDAARGIGLIKAAERLVDALERPVVKAGRVLSAANEAALRSAADAISKVLASLPAATEPEAPVTKTDAPVVKDDAVTPTTSPEGDPDVPANPTPADDLGAAGPNEAGPADVQKAGKPQVAVYDADGKLVGTIDQADLNPIQSATPPDGGDADGGSDAADLTPAPAGDAGVPAAAAPAAAAPTDTTTAVAKSDTGEGAPDEDLAEVVKALKARVDELEAPARSKVMVNGQVPPAHLLRGQDKGAPDTTFEKSDDLRKQLERTTDVAERERLTNEMNQQAADALARLRAR